MIPADPALLHPLSTAHTPEEEGVERTGEAHVAIVEEQDPRSVSCRPVDGRPFRFPTFLLLQRRRASSQFCDVVLGDCSQTSPGSLSSTASSLNSFSTLNRLGVSIWLSHDGGPDTARGTIMSSNAIPRRVE